MMKKIAGIGVMFTLVGIVSSPTVLANRQDARTVTMVKTVPLVLITRELKEPPLALVIQTPPVPLFQRGQPKVANATAVTQPRSRHLPQTASALPLIALVGLACIGGALGVLAFGKIAHRRT